MKTTREEEAEDGELPETKKRKLVNESDENGEAVNAVSNILLPLASYRDDDDDDEDEEQGNRGRRRDEDREELDDDEEEEGSSEDDSNRGPRHRQIEVRRDCPYLDTVNRQVTRVSSVSCFSFGIYCVSLLEERIPIRLISFCEMSTFWVKFALWTLNQYCSD